MTDSQSPNDDNQPATVEGGDLGKDGPAQSSTALPSPEAAGTTGRSVKTKVALSMSAVAVLLLGLLAVRAVSGGSSSASQDYIFVAYDPQGSGAYYSVEMKDGKAVVGARLSSQDLGSFDVQKDLTDNVTSMTDIVAIDKNTILMKQYPEGDDENEVEFVLVDLDTAQTTRLFYSDDSASAVYVVSEKTLFVTDDSDCFKVSLDGISTRIGAGGCNINSGRISAVSQDGDTTSFVYLDEKGIAQPPINITLEKIDDYSTDRTVVWGRDSSGRVVVYNALTGKQLWTYGDDSTLVSVLDSSNDGSSLLVTIDDISDSDSELEIAVVRDTDGSYAVNALASAYKAGGTIAPDGQGVLVFTQDLDASSGTLQYFGGDLKTTKSVASQVLVEDIGVSPTGAAVIVTDSQIITGKFSAGFEQKVNGKFTNLYGDNFFSVRGTDALVMNLVGASEDGGENQIVYLPSPLATDGDSNSIIVASGDENPYIFNNQSLARDSRIIYGTKSDDYVILNERELKKDATSARLVEGRISTYFEATGDELTYFETVGSDRYTTYSLKGSDAEDRAVVAEGYFIYRIPVGYRDSKIEKLSWNFYSNVAQVDDDLDECRQNGYTIIEQGSSARIELRVNYTGNYDWTYFCIENATQGYYTNVVARESLSFSSGKPLWMRLNCYDKDNSSQDFFDSTESAYDGGTGASGYYRSPSDASYATCRIADNANHGGWGTYYSVGGSVLVTVDSD